MKTKKNILQKEVFSGHCGSSRRFVDSSTDSLLSDDGPPDVDDGGGVGDCADPDVEVAALHQSVLHAGHHGAGVALTVPRCIEIVLCIELDISK